MSIHDSRDLTSRRSWSKAEDARSQDLTASQWCHDVTFLGPGRLQAKGAMTMRLLGTKERHSGRSTLLHRGYMTWSRRPIGVCSRLNPGGHTQRP
jgi:hypothetical protein